MRDENLARAVSGLSAEEINAANKAVRTRQYNPNSETSSMDLFDWLRARDTAQAISRMTVNNPQVFTNATFQVGKKTAPVHGVRRAFGNGQYRYAIDPTKYIPRRAYPGSSTFDIPSVPVESFIPQARQHRSYMAPSFVEFNYRTVPPIGEQKFNFRMPKRLAIMPPMIEQPMISHIPEINPPIGEQKFNFRMPKRLAIMPPMIEQPMISHIPEINPPIGTQFTIPGFKVGGEIPKFQDGGENIHKRGKKPKFNIPGMMDLTSAIVQSTAIGKAYDDKREAIKLAGLATKTSPRIQGTRFDVSPIDRQVNEAVEPYRQVQFNSSDNRENMAGELQRAKAISDIHERAGEQKTQAINQFNATEVQRANAQASQDAEVADANRALSAQVAASLKEADAAERNEKWAQV